MRLQGKALTTQPASFQGNRDESTNVDMSLVQRDVQVSAMARPGTLPGFPEPVGRQVLSS